MCADSSTDTKTDGNGQVSNISCQVSDVRCQVSPTMHLKPKKIFQFKNLRKGKNF